MWQNVKHSRGMNTFALLLQICISLALMQQTYLWPHERHLDAQWMFALRFYLFQLSSLSHQCSAELIFYLFIFYYGICFPVCHSVKGTSSNHSLWEFFWPMCVTTERHGSSVGPAGKSNVNCSACRWLITVFLVKDNQGHKASVSFGNKLSVSVNLTECLSAFPLNPDYWQHLPHVDILLRFGFNYFTE